MGDEPKACPIQQYPSKQCECGEDDQIYKISIHSGRIDFNGNSVHNIHRLIKHINVDPRYDRMFLIIETYSQDGSGGTTIANSLFQDLEILDNMKILRGRENNNIQIEYKRIK